MKYLQLYLVFLIISISISSAFAGSMRCGTHLIDADSGLTKAQVESKCGPPDSSQGNVMYYTKNNMKYRLHFDDGGELSQVSTSQE